MSFSERSPDRPLNGQVAVVTGAGAGLGRAHALELARLGAAVVVNDLGGTVQGTGVDSSVAQSVVDQIVAAGGRAVTSTESVAETGAGQHILAHAFEHFGRIDIVVNNAGILRDKDFTRLDHESWDAVLDVHLRGSFEVTRAAWPHLVAQDYGRVVFTTSAAGLFGNAGHANYGAAKAGVFGLMRMLAVEAAPHNIRVNAVAPLALTRMSSSKEGDRKRASDIAGAMFARMSPDQVAPLVAWLSHPECASNGQVYSVGGGRIAKIYVGETKGWVDRGLTWESVRDHWDEINAHGEDAIPQDMSDEIVLYLRALAAAEVTGQ